MSEVATVTSSLTLFCGLEKQELMWEKRLLGSSFL